jgi:hypothetical protein
MLLKQGRLYAKTPDQAAMLIRDKYGLGNLTIKLAPVQPRKDIRWFEYCIELKGGDAEGEQEGK